MARECGYKPRKAEGVGEAIFIDKLPTGTTVIIGREDREECIKTNDMRPLALQEYR